MTRLSTIALSLALLPGAVVAAPYVIPAPPMFPQPAPPAATEEEPPPPPAVAPKTPAVLPDHPSDTAAAACADGADSFNNVLPGTSKMESAHKQGDFWVITMASGTFRSLCTVSPNGQV